jgi:hypothetical protein
MLNIKVINVSKCDLYIILIYDLNNLHLLLFMNCIYWFVDYLNLNRFLIFYN